MRSRPRRGLRAAIIAIVAGCALALPALAAAAPGLPTAQAVVRLDLGRATLSTAADGSLRLALPKATRGQWLGGTVRAQVGALTAGHLRRLWKPLRLSAMGARATLAWRGASSARRFAVVRVSRPTLDEAGQVVLVLRPDRAVPATISGATLLIDRADARTTRSGFPTTQTYILSPSLSITTTISSQGDASGNVAQPSIVCGTTLLWTATLIATAPTVRSPSIECPAGGSTLSASTFAMTLPSQVTNGTVTLDGSTVTQGGSFTLYAVVADWTQTG
ncbi:MAG: hypothetical protein ACR2J9_00850 [Gaiellales bacterium]